MRLLLAVVVVVLPGAAAAQERRAAPADAGATVGRGLDFLVKDALAWKAKHNCASCHHAALVVWAMREAKQHGHAVNEPVLADLTKWVAESGDGRTGVPRPKGIPKALNGFGLWNALVLVLMAAAYGWPIAQFFADPPPQAVVHHTDRGID